jgi:hypothetical protein
VPPLPPLPPPPAVAAPGTLFYYEEDDFERVNFANAPRGVLQLMDGDCVITPGRSAPPWLLLSSEQRVVSRCVR